ncbi:MAG: DUF5684 domain-containing protein [Rikenellaceae bacterium]
MTLLSLLFVLLPLICWWVIFQKAGLPGWAAIIPIYNFLIMLKTAGKPWWWIFLFLIPVVNFIFMVLMMMGIASKFGRGTLFAAGLVFLPFIFAPILAFGDSKYNG